MSTQGTQNLGTLGQTKTDHWTRNTRHQTGTLLQTTVGGFTIVSRRRSPDDTGSMKVVAGATTDRSPQPPSPSTTTWMVRVKKSDRQVGTTDTVSVAEKRSMRQEKSLLRSPSTGNTSPTSQTSPFSTLQDRLVGGTLLHPSMGVAHQPGSTPPLPTDRQLPETSRGVMDTSFISTRGERDRRRRGAVGRGGGPAVVHDGRTTASPTTTLTTPSSRFLRGSRPPATTRKASLGGTPSIDLLT